MKGFELQKNSGLNPGIVSYLKAIPSEYSNHKKYSLRHPGAIYNLMSNKLIESMLLLTSQLQEKKVDTINSYIRLMFYDFFQFHESCYEIMLCFINTASHPEKFVNRWLQKNENSYYKKFETSLPDDLSILKSIYNNIKHTSNDIQSICFYNGNIITIGYYLELADAAAYKSPINPVSLYFELRRFFFLIYAVSEVLLGALKYYFKHTHNLEISPFNNTIKDTSFKKLSQAISGLPDFYLLNEIGNSTHTVLSGTDSVLFTKIPVTEDLYHKYYKSGTAFQMIINVDGYNNTVLVPQCGLTQINNRMYFKNSNEILEPVPILDFKLKSEA